MDVSHCSRLEQSPGLARSAGRPENPLEFSAARRARLTLWALLISSLGCGLGGALVLSNGEPGDALFLWSVAAANSVALLISRRGHDSRRAARLVAFSAAALFVYLVLLSGSAGHGGLWALVLVPGLFFLLGHRPGLAVFGVLIVAAGWLMLRHGLPVPPANPAYYAANWLGVLFVLGLYCWLLELDRESAIAQLLRSRQDLHRLAHTDELTGLANRRTMRQCLHQQDRRRSEGQGSFGLILADIDHFKAVNDQHGHDCGDQVIAAVARALTSALREHDTVARWGGEEFLVVLPDASLEGAMQVAIKLREAIADLSVSYQGHRLQPTLSYGVASSHQGGDAESCLKLADQRLYRAKTSGRNAIIGED